ncbi:hypothetical protein MJ904_22000 [Massilia sp. MB5]|uniref:hypothetical protein n=1 Tax=Massilia sp. MB5 TaxID=2919578 RepID=UPI001F0F165A|nr:hypothetical protein [Massilia sp. MB5]UMR29690.1 hypothetical protein MJ904_22000 [Massilia sp. MB5]
MKNLALIHSTACRTLLEEGLLDDALLYCLKQGIAPPSPPARKTRLNMNAAWRWRRKH